MLDLSLGGVRVEGQVCVCVRVNVFVPVFFFWLVCACEWMCACVYV